MKFDSGAKTLFGAVRLPAAPFCSAACLPCSAQAGLPAAAEFIVFDLQQNQSFLLHSDFYIHHSLFLSPSLSSLQIGK
ncbi:MAG: hypothetical protein AB1742_01500 [bacterium]